jgi:hypothetical protein
MHDGDFLAHASDSELKLSTVAVDTVRKFQAVNVPWQQQLPAAQLGVPLFSRYKASCHWQRF